MRIQVVSCIDVDYFFAQAEELRRPEVRGRPVVVCVYSGRTAISGSVASANYVARQFGVKAGMVIADAMESLKGTEAVFLPIDKSYYEELSKRVFAVVGKVGGVLEVASIDEGFLDVTDVVEGDFDSARVLMSDVKSEIRRDLGLSVSIGIGPNKLIAKMACDRSKPDGLMLIKPSEVRDFLAGRPVSELPYVGKKISSRLREFGVNTVDELARMDPQLLISNFGRKLGLYLHLASKGEHREAVEPRLEKSEISRIITLKEDTNDVNEIMAQLREPLLSLHRRLQQMGAYHRGIAAIVITDDLTIVSRSRTLTHLNQDLEPILVNLNSLFLKLVGSLGDKRVRRAGAKLFLLHPMRGQTNLRDY
ncbi:MAG: DNA polymerase IV [Aigarchaeota archaeon]|nr:DNA polymerase IV [Aigarchaeota archaeon]MDW8093084.1 DNA polymerase IV [Nitrososphaerota archaeon]